jgi:hypothetical protein
MSKQAVHTSSRDKACRFIVCSVSLFLFCPPACARDKVCHVRVHTSQPMSDLGFSTAIVIATPHLERHRS